MTLDSFHSSKLGAFLESALGARGVEGGVFGGGLIAGGFFASANGSFGNVSNIASFDGTLWNPLGVGTLGATNGTVTALAVHGGELYAGGQFTKIGNVLANRIAKYDPIGHTWIPLGTGIQGTSFTRVNTLISYGGMLFVGGIFDQAGPLTGLASVAAWNGSAWVNVGNPSGLPAAGNRPINSFINSGGSLFAGGNFNNGVFKVARYSGGTSWTQAGSFYNNNEHVTVLVSHSGTLYALGNSIITAGGFLWTVARWTGSAFQAFRAGGITGTPAAAISFQGKFVVTHSAFPNFMVALDPASTTPSTPDGTFKPYPINNGMTGGGATGMIVLGGQLVTDGGTKNPGNVAGVAGYSGSGNWVALGNLDGAGVFVEFQV